MSMDHARKLGEMARKRGEPYRVLIVDDEKWVREVFRDFCELTEALEIDLASNGASAVDMIGRGKYDLVTLDLVMPEVSGLEVLTAIKRTSPHLPVMIITGNATDKLVREAGVMGACRVMYKPIMMESFMAELASTLEK